MRFTATLLYCLSLGAAVTFALPTLVSRSDDLAERNAALELEGAIDEVSARAPMELGLDMEFQERQLEDSFLYPRNLPKKTKTAMGEALDVVEGETVSWSWLTSWEKAHGANTGKLQGYKPGSRRDSQGAKLYWVGLFKTAGKEIIAPPLIQASSAKEPTTAEAVAALRTALQNA
ncbi:hypothetical protein EST38_g9974 [Candolleomyces aberdarensis]|uniref:Uncharacterized protein n=1 Tax=Candolleomyces aberdarensis TaxID=2316362 RepID=A0A4Q2DAR5_9AGAR|nr:hypothetical protein EST38_g9974 [Candolleomyces aberdarensis]